ncbi:hypothetical protein DDZ14_11015 [Maritimibacter sp. 55A14]|uniref:hypothetical protein n=1 Tax=Maritimibacter sp. 55A14 TaxID=2174844 RepID=UPI000D61B4DF|nr:hypothetical protein [Maritimibacter sp. 55A14]PWE32256.1 hypothetical protein DDZ14_11015 [Maritimibacter sp. 55A14]
MTREIIFDPLLDPVVLAAVVLLVAAGIGVALWRGLPGWWLRGLAGVALLAALANPALKEEAREPLSDIVLAVVDESASQGLSDRPDQTARAVADLERRIAARGNTELRLIRVGDAPQGTDEGTLLMSALAEALAEEPHSRIAGALLITDGHIHDLDRAPEMPAPLHALLTGREGDWDRRLVVKNAPAFAIIGEPVTLTLRLEDQGAAPAGGDGTAELSIAIDGQEPQVFTVPVGRDMDLPLTLPHGGMNVIQFSTPEAQDELTARNNAAVVSINGVRDRLRVLLVSGEPHAGERTWRNLLKSDSSVDLVHFTILRPPMKQDGVPVDELSLIAFPTRELFLEKVDEFDLIIFDRYRQRGILPMIYLDSVRSYVEKGGAVLLSAGPEFAGAESLWRSPLSEVLPAAPTANVVERGFLPRVSDIGARHPVTSGLEDFAPRESAADGTPGWGRWLRQIEVTPESGHTVMTGAGERPLLQLDRVGEGRIALLASDHAWLWNRGYEGGGPQLELLRRLAHWMMGEPELEEEALRATAQGGMITITRRSLEDGARSVTLTAPDGTERELALREEAPGRHSATYEAPQMGLYRLADETRETVVAVGPAAPREYAETIASGARLEPVLDAAGGGILRLEDGFPQLRDVREGRVAAGRGWLGLTPRDAYVTADIRVSPLLPAILFLLMIAALSIAAWLREGR